MARVTQSEVEAILADDVPDEVADFTPFITAGNLIVTDNLSDSALGISTATLKEIERWIVAHLVRVRSPMASSEKAGPVSEAAQYKLGLNLQVTTYGQQAIMLDPTGTLAMLSSGVGGGLASTISIDIS